jgi:hypothetical protein
LFNQAISVVSPGKPVTEEGKSLSAILKANEDFMDGLYRTLKESAIWKIFPTTGYKLLAESHKIFSSILKTSLQSAQTDFKNSPEEFKKSNPFMYEIMQNEELNEQDVVMLAMETFIGGIDAVSYLLRTVL